jgi:ribonuclease-3
MTDINSLKKIFKDDSLLDQALTHKSWVNEHPNTKGTNERLEFLGDAILEYVVSKELFDRFPKKEEGYLTALRANLVNTVNLAGISQKLGVGEVLKLSKGEEETGGRTNPSLLADTFEAILGALYIDQGLAKAEKFISKNVLVDIEDKIKMPLKDAKSRLQEYVQAKGSPAPKYKVVKESGPDHSKEFIVEVVIDAKPVSAGKGKSKGEAEQDAAKKALTALSL